MPVRWPVAHRPLPDPDLHPAQPQLPQATWSRPDSRNLLPQVPHARRYRRRKRKGAKEAGSRRKWHRRQEEVSEWHQLLYFHVTFFFGPLKKVDPNISSLYHQYLKDSFTNPLLVALLKQVISLKVTVTGTIQTRPCRTREDRSAVRVLYGHLTFWL